MLTPASAYELWLTGEGTDPSDRRHPAPSHYIGQRNFRLPFRGVRSPQVGPSASVLTARISNGPNLLWRSLSLPG
jgi:hypothetical protein